MADYKEILYEKRRKGALITLNRPQTMNALNQSLLKEMHQALDEAEADPEVRAIVLTGAGRAFSSGMEQGGPRTGRRAARSWPSGIPSGLSAAEYLDAWRGDSRNLLRLWELGKPVIGAINGWAMGAGSWLAIGTHITIASENAVFSQPETLLQEVVCRHDAVHQADPRGLLRVNVVADEPVAQGIFKASKQSPQEARIRAMTNLRLGEDRIF